MSEQDGPDFFAIGLTPRKKGFGSDGSSCMEAKGAKRPGRHTAKGRKSPDFPAQREIWRVFCQQFEGISEFAKIRDHSRVS